MLILRVRNDVQHTLFFEIILETLWKLYGNAVETGDKDNYVRERACKTARRLPARTPIHLSGGLRMSLPSRSSSLILLFLLNKTDARFSESRFLITPFPLSYPSRTGQAVDLPF